MATPPFIGRLQQTMATIPPWFLRQKNAGRFLQAIGLVLDGEAEGFDQAMRLSQPLRCDTSALPVIASNRTMRTYPSESEQATRARLAQWWQLQKQRGTHVGEMRHSRPYFTPATPVMRCVFQAGDGLTATWWTLDANGDASIYVKSPSNWPYFPSPWKAAASVTGATNADPIVVTTDEPHGLTSRQTVRIAGVLGNTAANGDYAVQVTSPTTFSIDVAGSGAYTSGGTVSVNVYGRFAFILYPPADIYSLTYYDDGAEYDADGVVYDGITSAQAARDLVAMVTEWQSAHSVLWAYILATDPASFDPTADAVTMPSGWTTLPVAGNWRSPISPAGVYTRPPSALWIYDMGAN